MVFYFFILKYYFSISFVKDIFDQYFVRSYVINEKQEGKCDLESHHSHFLFFDDGKMTNDPSIVLSKRTQIEKSLNENIPLILILIEGGLSSIKAICQALQENTPIIIIKVIHSILYQKIFLFSY
jgi:hypothetical protein